MDEFIAQKAIRTARSAQEAWQQWFVADPAVGLVCALKDCTKEMIRLDRKKYSERCALATAFSKYQSYQQFEAWYQGFTSSYAKIPLHHGVCKLLDVVVVETTHTSTNASLLSMW
ncbi:hypothetical protein H310_06926 [Aphanomyces invadans]|uniref:Uncharacterized protein n=1 Tax=Aphanomyces invadans TaxID=157072 RepID=A0A024U4Q1_9STRA|nr:hypothetical protein H310_06926 [Aphanomyces invadans]ETW01376.1 hypothetical protein H310_06926 [Aphanomyces invadans]|eukprot:XP_008870374.1 hypothetical protein H310_06926 [Aphanomyces invadans]